MNVSLYACCYHTSVIDFCLPRFWCHAVFSQLVVRIVEKTCRNICKSYRSFGRKVGPHRLYLLHMWRPLSHIPSREKVNRKCDLWCWRFENEGCMYVIMLKSCSPASSANPLAVSCLNCFKQTNLLPVSYVFFYALQMVQASFTLTAKQDEKKLKDPRAARIYRKKIHCWKRLKVYATVDNYPTCNRFFMAGLCRSPTLGNCLYTMMAKTNENF